MDDIQSWWEVPSIAHFCSLFRAAFNLLDFDIEELEEALLTDGTEDSGSSLLQELIVRLLCGCLGNNDISTFNYQMFLRRLFRQKCQEYGRDNPFNTDIDFQFLPLRTKVEILHALCDFRLDADDVQDLLKNLESDSLRVVPLGYDENKSAYWYFYGTRLYREDFPKREEEKAKEKRKKGHEDKRRKKHSKSQSESDSEEEQGVWQVICFTESDWDKVTHSFKDSSSKCEKALFHTLVEDFLPEIPRLFAEKERLQRKRMLEYRPRRQSTRLEKLKQQKEEEERIQLKEHQLRIQVEQEHETKERFKQSEEDLQTGLYKILEHIKTHEDAWPFIDPVDEAYAPRYYSIISKPMDLKCMEDKLDEGRYNSFSEFKADFQLIVDNCRISIMEQIMAKYTEMVGNLLEAFRHASDRYLESDPSSDEEIAVEFPRSPPEKQLQPVRHRARRKKKKKKKKVAEDDSPRESPRSLSTSSVHSSESERNARLISVRSKAETESEKEEFESASKGPPSSNNSNKYRTNVSKNSVEAIEALELATEQTLKDINKWLDDTPRFSEFSSASNSPSHFIRAEEYEIVASGIEQDYRRSLKLDRVHRKDGPKRRPNKDPLKLQRRREIQRTIDRLQPGKSKGNLISNIQSVNKTADDGSSILGKPKDKINSLLNNIDEKAPKLSLGTVLTSDVLKFGVGGQSHNFDEEFKDNERKSLTSDASSSIFREVPKSVSPEPQTFSVAHTKKEKDDEEEKPLNKEIKQEKPTPNLSAWFKAFGAPKTVVNQKKKPDTLIKPEETIKMKKSENSVISPNPSSVDTHADIEQMWSDRRNIVSQGLISESDQKFVHSPPHSRLTDEPSSPVGPPVLQGMPRQRRVSTGSSVSERSSFSQDTDGCSPRLTLDERLGSYPGPYPSPLHRSPMTASPVMASPRSEDIPKPTPYPPVNGTIRVGFYQDTSSSFQKNSPEKSNMSPRDRITPSSLPNYSPRLYSAPHDPGGFVPYRGQVPPAYDNLSSYGIPSLMQYYDKSVIDQYKVIRTQATDDYPSSTVSSTTISDTSSHTSVTSKTPATMFPVKKRLYSEMESGIGPTRVHSSLTETDRISSPHSSPCSSPHHSPPQNLQDPENKLYPSRSPENSSVCRTSNSNSPPSPHVTDRLHLPRSSPQLYPSNLSTSSRSPLIRLPQTTVSSHLSEKINVDTLPQGKLNEVCSLASSLPVSQVLSRTQQSAFDKSGANVNKSNSETKTLSDSTTVPNVNSPPNSPLSMVKRLSPPNTFISHTHQILQHKSLHSASSKVEGACDSPENQPSLSLKEDHRSVRVPDIGYHRPPYSPVPPNSIPIDTTLSLRGNISHMVDRYNSEERMMQVPTTPFYGNKSLFGQTPSTALQVPVSSVSMFEKTSSSVTSTVHEMPVLSGRMADMQAVYTRAVPDLPSILATKTSVANPSSPYTSAVSDLSVITNKVSSPLNIPPSYMRPVASDLSIPRKEIASSDGPRIYNHPNADLPPSVLSSKVSSGMNIPPNYSRSTQEMSGVYNKGRESPSLVSSKTSRKKKTKQQTTAPETPVMNPSTAFQHYVGNKSLSESSPISLKATSIVPGSAFNFGPAPTTLGLYADKESYPAFLDEYRASAPSFYVGSDPAREKSNTATPSFPFLSHPQARPPSYPYINQSPLMEPSSPLYQQYLQRHQEELLRHSGTPMVLHQGLLAPPTGFAPGYHPALSIRQPYDALNRPSWL